jgi:uncharacterized membrane protein YqjE
MRLNIALFFLNFFSAINVLVILFSSDTFRWIPFVIMVGNIIGTISCAITIYEGTIKKLKREVKIVEK